MMTIAQSFLLGDEAVAFGALHAGITSAYGYPGTPSTEILERLIQHHEKHRNPLATWCVNEKTAYEQALGVSLAGRRALVTMKHVGLNVAADPFMNSALLSIEGGLVVVVADDPGMHSSQNEQDTRYYADFGHVICLEPASQQQAYDMTREAFELSEKFKVPVVLRLVTRLAHSRTGVCLAAPREQKALHKTADPAAWTLMPANARKQWQRLLEKQKQFLDYTENCAFNALEFADKRLGVITSGIAKNYLDENIADLAFRPSRVHVGAYPIPLEKIRALVAHVDEVLVLEEGYPYIERLLVGLIPPRKKIRGRLSQAVPREGELTPDSVRSALGLAKPVVTELSELGVTGPLPSRPPQLCQGCPHGDSYAVLKQALQSLGHRENQVVASDIGCYTLGALPPYSAVESCVCMGASIGMAKGASDAGIHPAVAIIGDSTFLHSGITPLIDAIAANSHMTVMILDNEAVAMTGGQKTMLPSSRIEKLVLGLGANPEHVKVIEAHRKNNERNTEIVRRELVYRGLSIVIAVRECLETAKRSKTK